MNVSKTISGAPMLAPAVGMALGCWSASGGALHIPTETALMGMAAMTIIMLAYVGISAWRMWRPREVALCGLFCGMVFLFGHINAGRHRTPYMAGGEDVSLTGTVESVDTRRDNYTRMTIVADSVLTPDGIWTRARGEMSIGRKMDDIWPGQKIAAHGRTRQRQETHDDEARRERAIQNGLSFSIVADSVTTSEPTETSLTSTRGRAQDLFTTALRKSGVSEGNIGFLRALILGDRSLLDPSLRQSFADCGIAHVLAVSGMHTGLIFIVLQFFFIRVARLRKASATAVATICIWGYAAITGMSAPVFRAAVMLSVSALGRLMGRRANVMQTLSVSLITILVFQPYAITSIGLWLSLTAVGAIISVSDTVSMATLNMSWAKSWLTQNVAISIVAQVATTPLTLYAFHCFPTYFLANNLVVPVALMLIMPAAVLCVALCWVPGVGCALGWITDTLIDGLTIYTQWASALPLATLTGIHFSAWQMACALALVGTAIGLILHPQSNRMLNLTGASLVALVGITWVTEHNVSQRKEIWLNHLDDETVVSIVSGRTAMHFCTDTANARVRSALTDDADRGVSEHTFRLMTDGMDIAAYGKKIHIASGQPTAAGNDVCIVTNADRLPLDEDDDSTSYYIMRNATFRDAWLTRKKSVTVMTYRAERVILSD